MLYRFTLELGTIIITILYMEKLKLNEVEKTLYVHTHGKWWSRGSIHKNKFQCKQTIT